MSYQSQTAFDLFLRQLVVFEHNHLSSAVRDLAQKVFGDCTFFVPELDKSMRPELFVVPKQVWNSRRAEIFTSELAKDTQKYRVDKVGMGALDDKPAFHLTYFKSYIPTR